MISGVLYQILKMAYRLARWDAACEILPGSYRLQIKDDSGSEIEFEITEGYDVLVKDERFNPVGILKFSFSPFKATPERSPFVTLQLQPSDQFDQDFLVRLYFRENRNGVVLYLLDTISANRKKAHSLTRLAAQLLKLDQNRQSFCPIQKWSAAKY